MSEKTMVSSRFVWTISISVLLLVLSSLFLLQLTNHSFIPKSVLDLVLVNKNTSLFFKPNFNREQINTLPPLPSEDLKNSQPQVPLREIGCQVSNSSQETTTSSVRLQRKNVTSCDPTKALLRVFMYDLPPEFHFGLLGWKGSILNQTWPNVDNPKNIPQYPGGLTIQNSVEYWLTLDLLSSSNPKIFRPCTAIRVQNSSQADVIFVPFFSSLSYNHHGKEKKDNVHKMLQDRLVKFLMGREEWKRSGGKDHVIVAHHPNSIKDARKKLSSAMLVLADFGRYPVKLANIGKDIIAPYKHLVDTIPKTESAAYEKRSTLLYFRGGIHRKDGGAIRQELYYLLKDEKGVYFADGSINENGINEASKGMALSKFCLNIAGDTPSSNRLFDSIVSHCVPVIISDEIELPFEDALDYSEFALFVHASDGVQKGYLLNLLHSIKKEKWTKMWKGLKEITLHFEYQYPSLTGDAVNMIWEEVAHKASIVKFNLHRKSRYQRS